MPRLVQDLHPEDLIQPPTMRATTVTGVFLVLTWNVTLSAKVMKKFREARMKACPEEKAKSHKVTEKTSAFLDTKPWNDATDHNAMLKSIKDIKMNGILWGASKLTPISYGVTKLKMVCTAKYDKISMEELHKKIKAFED